MQSLCWFIWIPISCYQHFWEGLKILCFFYLEGPICKILLVLEKVTDTFLELLIIKKKKNIFWPIWSLDRLKTHKHTYSMPISVCVSGVLCGSIEIVDQSCFNTWHASLTTLWLKAPLRPVTLRHTPSVSRHDHILHFSIPLPPPRALLLSSFSLL